MSFLFKTKEEKIKSKRDKIKELEETRNSMRRTVLAYEEGNRKRNEESEKDREHDKGSSFGAYSGSIKMRDEFTEKVQREIVKKTGNIENWERQILALEVQIKELEIQ